MTLRSNAEELAFIAQEIGAEVVRGTVGYPERGGGFDIGDVETEQLLSEPKGPEVMPIIASLFLLHEMPTISGPCGTHYDGD
jgi:hypothetical protein